MGWTSAHDILDRVEEEETERVAAALEYRMPRPVARAAFAAFKEDDLSTKRFPCRFPGCMDERDTPQGRGSHEYHAHGGWRFGDAVTVVSEEIAGPRKKPMTTRARGIRSSNGHGNGSTSTTVLVVRPDEPTEISLDVLVGSDAIVVIGGVQFRIVHMEADARTVTLEVLE